MFKEDVKSGSYFACFISLLHVGVDESASTMNLIGAACF